MDRFDNDKYERAKKQVKEIKGFYTHLGIYIIVNITILLVHLGLLSGQLSSVTTLSIWSFATPFFWGIGLLGHGFHVFQDKFSFYRNWEERKIKEFMEKDEEEFKNTSRRS